MRIFFVIALLSTLGGVYLFKKSDDHQLAMVRQDCQGIEAEIKQCATAEKTINKEIRRKAILTAENKRLKALLKQNHK